MDAEFSKRYFSQEGIVQEYARAAASLGLWVSEEKLFQSVFDPEDSLLEVGTGAGRIAIGLYELGYRRILALDCCRPMVEEARRINAILGYGISFQVGDATSLRFPDGLFEGAIFGFNGLMQIPGREARRRAMQEIRRVLRPGSRFVFTTHDRAHSAYRDFWREETRRWEAGTRDPRLWEFGDRIEPSEYGEPMFIHIPTVDEVTEDLEVSGWDLEYSLLRSDLASEPEAVREFSDDCVFWVVRRPEV